MLWEYVIAALWTLSSIASEQWGAWFSQTKKLFSDLSIDQKNLEGFKDTCVAECSILLNPYEETKFGKASIHPWTMACSECSGQFSSTNDVAGDN